MDEDEAGTPPRRRFVVFSLYMDAILKAGGLPLALGSFPASASQLADKLDGLLLTGGDFDIPPALYGASDIHPSVKTKPQRTEFELKICQEFLMRDKAILGICGGAQVINVAMGGTLIQDIGAKIKDCLTHEQPPPRSKPHHKITIEPNSRLATIIGGATHMNVNSAHHQAIDKLGEGLRINARASDGVIEGIESNHHHFCLGAQWHPEFHVDIHDKDIFKAFITACTR